MTETVSKNFQQWTGDAVTTAFSMSSVNVQDASHLAVYLDDTLKTITTDYTVAIASEIATVTFLSAPDTDVRVTVVRQEPLLQSTDLTTINTFRAEGFEGALDSIVRQIYRLWHKLSRSLTLPDSNVDGSGQFNARSNRIGSVGDPTDDQDVVTKAFAENRYALQSAGGGDMFKASYDSNADGTVDSADTASAAPWSGITGKPSVFPPDTHTHTASDVTDFSTAADARITNTILSEAAWEDGVGTDEGVVSPAKIAAAIAALAAGGGDMIKATYDTDNDGKVDAAVNADIAPWSGLTGVPATFAPSTHSHTASDVSDFAGGVATAASGATAKTTPVDADTVPLTDSAASNALKKVTWANIKATLKTYFDTVYGRLGTLQTWTALQASSVETLSDGATITPTGTKNLNQVTLGGNRTMANPTSITVGATYLFKIIQDATGSRTLAWGGAYEFPGGTPATLTTAANGVDVLSGVSFDGTTIQMFTPGQDFS